MTRFIRGFSGFCIRRRVPIISVLAILTVIFGLLATQISVRTIFKDMLPLSNPWIQTQQKYKNTFGGANLVTIMVTARHGTIFQRPVLKTVQSITRDLRKVDAVDSFQITSLASQKLKTVKATSFGIDSVPLMWPKVPKTQAGITSLREAVIRNPVVYGAYVSRDLRSTLIKVNFIDRLVNYPKIFQQLRATVHRDADPALVKVDIIGQPMLYGWVHHYLPQTVEITLLTIGMLSLTLFLLARTWRGTLLPLLAGITSACWSLGIAHLLKMNFDPLVAVVAFLITARSISHSVQLVTRYEDLRAAKGNVPLPEIARTSLAELFRPGMLGVAADAGAILVVLLTPIPMLQKVSIIGAIWVGSIAVSAVVMTPILLSFLRNPGGAVHPVNLDRLMHRFLQVCVRIAVTRGRYVAIGVAVALLLGSGALASRLQVGDARPGSPILRYGSEYNQSARAINHKFAGTNRLYVVIHGAEDGALRDPRVLRKMRELQYYMQAQPQVGATSSLVDVISSVNQALHGGNPRYDEVGDSPSTNGQFLYLYVSGSDPGDLNHYSDANFRNGAVTMMFRDHTGDTIRTAITRVQEFIHHNPMTGASYKLAGGLIGVLAAVNDVLLKGQIEAIALGLLVVVLAATAVYRSTVAGMLFMIPVLLSNMVTFAFMALTHVGLNINTVPVVALGIGLGVDYSFYVVDGIREELAAHGDFEQAVVSSLHSAGRGVLVTGLTLIVSVFLWTFSSLRFQAEMGVLIAVWLAVSASSALLLMPGLVYVFRPRFIFSTRQPSTPASTAGGQRVDSL
ncbi:MAG TPA: MMPL family transporter [Gammaproteobacteria bacterium]|nr:MMPL family transporter [Gammaproteobacteria bacterium]